MNGFSDDLEESFREQIDITKGVLKFMDDEFYKLQAEHWRKLYNAARDTGFTPDESLALVSSSLRAVK